MFKVDQAQDKFPRCISLVSISFVKRTSSFLRFTDFLLVAYRAKFKSKTLCKISKWNWELSRWSKVTKHRYATTVLYSSYKYKTRISKIQQFMQKVSGVCSGLIGMNFKFGRCNFFYFY